MSNSAANYIIGAATADTLTNQETISGAGNIGDAQMTLVNSGSVGMPFDSDYRASYALIDGPTAQIRRVAYDLERELKALKSSPNPGADWTARILQTASPQLPLAPRPAQDHRHLPRLRRRDDSRQSVHR